MENWVERIRGGDLRALARAATAVENRRPEAASLLRELFPYTGRARMIGVTGAPGAGKSTIVNELARLLRAEGFSIGILAVDPTSPYSGGALLGDRIRMLRHHADPGVFIRSMATRGTLGGLASATIDLALLLDAAGRDYVLIETVGVGQDEVEVARLADTTVVVLVPGMGDDVQAIKAGLMEIADVFLINKADHPGAGRLKQEVEAALALAPRNEEHKPPIITTVASEGSGIREALDAIRASPIRQSPAEVWKHRLRQMYRERLAERVPPGSVEAAAHEVAARTRDPYSIVDEWLGQSGFSIDHLGVAVQSIDEALRFYERHLGMRRGPIEIVAEERVRVVMLAAGGPRIELLEATGPDSVIAKFIDKRGEGLHHVALRVADFSATVERLKFHGARLLNDPRAGAGGHIYVFVHPASTRGVLLELIQA